MPVDKRDQFEIFNDTDDVMPMGGVVYPLGEVDGAIGSTLPYTERGELRVGYPTADSQSGLVVVTGSMVPPRNSGTGTYDARVILAFDPNGAAPANGDSLGSQIHSFYPLVGNTGFTCYGGRVGGLCSAIREQGSACDLADRVTSFLSAEMVVAGEWTDLTSGFNEGLVQPLELPRAGKYLIFCKVIITAIGSPVSVGGGGVHVAVRNSGSGGATLPGSDLKMTMTESDTFYQETRAFTIIHNATSDGDTLRLYGRYFGFTRASRVSVGGDSAGGYYVLGYDLICPATDSGSGSGSGSESPPPPPPPPNCEICLDGAPASWPFTLADGTDDFAGANGDWALAYTTGCVWEQTIGDWTATLDAQANTIVFSGPEGAAITYANAGAFECCGENVFALDSSTGTGTPPDAPTLDTEGPCDPPCQAIQGWDRSGFYCTFDAELGRCVANELFAIDRCNTDIQICSPRFDTLAEAEAFCPEPIPPDCPTECEDNELPNVYQSLIGDATGDFDGASGLWLFTYAGACTWEGAPTTGAGTADWTGSITISGGVATMTLDGPGGAQLVYSGPLTPGGVELFECCIGFAMTAMDSSSGAGDEPTPPGVSALDCGGEGSGSGSGIGYNVNINNACGDPWSVSPGGPFTPIPFGGGCESVPMPSELVAISETLMYGPGMPAGYNLFVWFNADGSIIAEYFYPGGSVTTEVGIECGIADNTVRIFGTLTFTGTPCTGTVPFYADLVGL
jgi:hypothetical protein